MASKARAKATNKKATPGVVLREGKQRMRAAQAAAAGLPLAGPEAKALYEERTAAAREIAELQVPMTLRDLCDIIGAEVYPDDFASSVLHSIARDIDALSVIANHEAGESGFDNWCLFQSLAERARVAGEVAHWLENGGPAEPEVTP